MPDVSDELDVLTTGMEDIVTLADKAAQVVVPTIFPGFNRAIRIGGAPTECICTLHGPSKGGKTAFALGLVVSFQLQGHMTVYIDAEHTLDKLFAVRCGVDEDQMQYVRPQTYEETTAKVEKLIKNFKKGRDNGTIHPDRCVLFVVDSITKLVPENELKELSKVGKGYPIRALMNTVWLDRLTPMIGSLPIFFVMLAHEKVVIDAGTFEKKWRVKGGESLIYDATMAVRCKLDRIRRVTKKIGGKDKRVEVAQIHRCVIEKSKVGICHEQFYFVVANGKGEAPIGFDHAEEVMEEAKLRGTGPLVRKSGGNWQSQYFDSNIKGDPAVARKLRGSPMILNNIIADMNMTAVDAVVDDAEREDDA